MVSPLLLDARARRLLRTLIAERPGALLPPSLIDAAAVKEPSLMGVL